MMYSLQAPAISRSLSGGNGVFKLQLASSLATEKAPDASDGTAENSETCFTNAY